jgi:transposase
MDKRFLEDCLAKGMSLEGIGERVSRHPSTVSYWLRKHGLAAHGAAKHASRGGVSRDELEPLVLEGLTIEQIAQSLGVGDTTARHWLKTRRSQRRVELDLMHESGQREAEAECRKHGLVRHVSVASERRLRCTKCRAEAVSRRRRKVKEILVEEAGGKCSICGYARHSAALQFHHVDPSTKSFGLGVRGITRSIGRLREEAAKCVLLCANCHAELEVGAVELPVKSGSSSLVRCS